MFVVLNNTLNVYDKLIKKYKKVYEREPKDDKRYTWKKKYSTKNLKVLDYQPVKLGTKSLSDENRSYIKQPTKLKQLNLNEISKPLWIELSSKRFDLLIKDVVNNLDNKDYKTTVNNRWLDLKDVEKFLLEIITKNISEMKHANCIIIWWNQIFLL